MKNLAQVFIAMAEAGVRLQTGEETPIAGARHHAVTMEVAQFVSSECLAADPGLQEAGQAATTD